MNTFSCRAECAHDTGLFLQMVNDAGINVEGFDVRPHTLFPDVELQFDAQADMPALLDVLRSIPDSHVMLETLRACPLSKNSLERDETVS